MAKLIDILARELKVWPGAADYAVQHGTPEVYFFPDGSGVERPITIIRCEVAYELASTCTRSQWQAARDALQSPALHAQEVGRITRVSPEWDGEGLPPVGTKCELTFEHWSEWEQCTVLCIGEKMIFVRQVSRSGKTTEGSMNREGVMFRPIRTPEQIEADEREQACRQICLDAGSPECTASQMGTAYRLFDAGYRKQEPKQCGS